MARAVAPPEGGYRCSFPVSLSWLPSEAAPSPHLLLLSGIASPINYLPPSPCLGLTFCRSTDDSLALEGVGGACQGKCFPHENGPGVLLPEALRVCVCACVRMHGCMCVHVCVCMCVIPCMGTCVCVRMESVGACIWGVCAHMSPWGGRPQGDLRSLSGRRAPACLNGEDAHPPSSPPSV